MPPVRRGRYKRKKIRQESPQNKPQNWYPKIIEYFKDVKSRIEIMEKSFDGILRKNTDEEELKEISKQLHMIGRCIARINTVLSRSASAKGAAGVT